MSGVRHYSHDGLFGFLWSTRLLSSTEAKLEVRVTNHLSLPRTVLALALNVPHPGKTRMVGQSNWHRILSRSEKSTSPYLGIIFHLVNLCVNLWLAKGKYGSHSGMERGDSGFPAILPTLQLHGIWKVLCAWVFTPRVHTPVAHSRTPSRLTWTPFLQRNSFLLSLQKFYWFLNLWPLLCHHPISFTSHIASPKGWICGSMSRIHKRTLPGCRIQDQ